MTPPPGLSLSGAGASGPADAVRQPSTAPLALGQSAGPGDPLGGRDPEAIRAARSRADAEGVIRRVHAYCEGWCPRRERCPGEACRLYRGEQAAKDVIARADEIETYAPEVGPGGVILEPSVA